MVIYFSRSKKTEVFARVLGEIKSLPLFELRSELNEMPTFRFVIKALWLTIRGKIFPVDKIPEHLPNEIYVCSPVWGGSVAPTVKYFLQNADIANIKVNILLTASTPTDKYVKNAASLLKQTSCIAGDVFIFATSSAETLPDADIIREHMKELL